MDSLITSAKLGESTARRAAELFREQQVVQHKHTDRMFAWLMVIQWVAGIGAALFISPRTWAGSYSHTHIHVWAAVVLGGAITSFPVFLALTRSGTVFTRHTIAVGQMLTSALLIHLTGGRIETHFHVFGSLAFLAFYRDWRVLLSATVVIAADHFVRGLFWPQSVFGVLAASPWRWLEHAGWVLFEDVFLFLAIQQNLREMLAGAERQARLETVNEVVEHKVSERTAELQQEIAERKRAERQLSVEYAVSRVLAESAPTEQATPKILQAICETLGWNLGALWIVDHRANVLRCAEIWSAPNPRLDGFKVACRQLTCPRGIGLPGQVWAGRQPVWVANATQDGNFPRAAAADQAGLRAAFAVPILIGNGVGGVMEFFSDEIRQPDDTAPRALDNISTQLGQFFERKRVEERLVESQKMETVGKLAGGVAHEFNSIMTAIIGQSELLLNDLPQGNSMAKNATEIRKAADRAAMLTRQLLAYGRKQILEPEILDLNHVLTGMEDMLRHLLGRDVDLRIAPLVGLKTVKVDAGQIEQVIVNMVMNAADAMPNGGKLTLETANVTLDAEYVSRFGELSAGDYVMLALSDTGAGMTEEVKARVFEPFFSTKGVGKGTGLGLATCHGIIRQSNGHVTVYSEPGRGATFKIYLPQIERPTQPLTQPRQSLALPRGTETILLVEDDPALREMSATLLERLGYAVQIAAHGVEAMHLSQQQDLGHIDLLFTDVVMPHMNGKELSDRIQVLHPQTRILFTSAYTENAIVHQGMLKPGIALLQKPFTPSALAHKVREILDAKSAVPNGT